MPAVVLAASEERRQAILRGAGAVANIAMYPAAGRMEGWMFRPTSCVLVIAACAIATCLGGKAAAQEVNEVRTSFESPTIPAEFVACRRPESAISISTDRARSGRRSLSLAITERPLFPPLESVSWSPSSQFCFRPDRPDEYRTDDTDRAELWENKDLAPEFGQEAWYGFSMWVDRASTPYGGLQPGRARAMEGELLA